MAFSRLASPWAVPVSLSDFVRVARPFLQNVFKGFVRYLIPLDSGLLFIESDVRMIRVYFFKNIRYIARNQNVFKDGDAAAVCSRIFIYRQPGQRCAVQAKGYTLDKLILRGFDYFQSAPLENIAERDRSGLSAYHSYATCFLWLVFIFCLFGHFIDAGPQIFQKESSVRLGANILLDAVAADMEWDISDLAVLADFDELDIAVRRFGF